MAENIIRTREEEKLLRLWILKLSQQGKITLEEARFFFEELSKTPYQATSPVT